MDPNDKKIEEVAKAAAEVAKFGTQTVKTTEKILRFSSKVFKIPVEETAGIIGDRLKLFRWERQVAYVDKVNSILDTKGITDTRAVAPKFALPILENASLEDDEELQKIWANLMVSAMNPAFTVSLRFAFVEIIKSLTPLDAKILKTFYDLLKSDSKINWTNIQDYSITKERLCQALYIQDHDYQVSVFNLFRSQCLAPAIIVNTQINVGGEHPTTYKGTKAVTLTPLGVDFIEGCLND